MCFSPVHMMSLYIINECLRSCDDKCISLKWRRFEWSVLVFAKQNSKIK